MLRSFEKNGCPILLYPTAESDSVVCIIPQSQARCSAQNQTAHCGVQIKIFPCLWLPLKGQSGKPFRGEHIYCIMKEKTWSKRCWLTKPIIMIQRCHAHRRVKIFKLCDLISWRNQNRFRQKFQPVYQGPRWVWIMKKKIEVKNLPTHSLLQAFQKKGILTKIVLVLPAAWGLLGK